MRGPEVVAARVTAVDDQLGAPEDVPGVTNATTAAAALVQPAPG